MLRVWIGELWLHRLIFLAVVLALLVLRLLPFDTAPGRLHPPPQSHSP